MRIFSEKQYQEEVRRIREETERQLNQWQHESMMEERLCKLLKEVEQLRKSAETLKGIISQLDFN